MTHLSPEEIAEQQALLAAYRRTLAIYVLQEAELGGHAYSPPALINGTADARRNIARIKRLLLEANVVVADDPDDEARMEPPILPAVPRRPTEAAPPPAAAIPPRRRGRGTPLLGIAVAGVVLVLVLGWLGARALGLAPFRPATPTFMVQGASMAPTFMQGQVVTIEPVASTALRRGDVVLITVNGKPFVKRIIGLPRDTVWIHDGQVFLNGTRLDEPYVHGAATICRPDDGCSDRAITVLDGLVFVLGDNRMNSSDSRDLGPMPIAQIQGRVR